MAKAVVELAPGVYRIPTLGDYINSFAFLDTDGQVTLVDCGLKRAPARIVRALASLGKHPKDVTRILLTHAHADHAGGAGELVASTTTDGVHVHTDDAPFARSGSAPPRDTSTGAGRLFSRLPGGGFAPVDVREELHSGQMLDICGGLEVIHTPGHTPGHVSLMHRSSSVLITGDSIFNMNARMTWPFAAFCTSFAQAKQTASILADQEFHTAAFTHGPEIAGNGREAIRGFLSRKSR